MKKTLLEITTDVLNAIDGEEVNSISDTIEALQVAKDIENVYWDILGRKEWQFLRKLTAPTSVADSNYPNYLRVPDGTKQILDMRYNKRDSVGARDKFRDVYFVYPDEFLTRVNPRDDTASNYTSITDYNGSRYTIRTDKHPSFYTTFDDDYLVFDAVNQDVESTLQGSETQMLAVMLPTWTHEDGFTPYLPAEMFPLFVAECMSFSLAKKEGQLIQKTEQTAGRQQRHQSQRAGALLPGVRLPNYGRRSKKAQARNRPAIFGPKS